jgi:uncharacterized protein (TIGR02145 family)
MKSIVYSIIYFLLIFLLSSGCKKDPFEKDSGVFTDPRDHNNYNWVRIGDQIWLAENMGYDTGYDCWVYNNDEINVVTMGRLYTWASAQNACPAGWHLPSDIEWEELAYYVSLTMGPYEKVNNGDDWEVLAIHLKSTSGWANDSNGTDDFGFNGRPTGGRSYNNDYFHKGEYVYWWSSTAAVNNNSWFRYMSYYSNYFLRDFLNRDYAFSVRCIKD